jgi:hypothetical protein
LKYRSDFQTEKWNQVSAVIGILEAMAENPWIGAGHVCLYLAICECRDRARADGMFYIRREELMRLAKIRGTTTYFRYMATLGKLGYIEYWPSTSKFGRSKVRVMSPKCVTSKK